MNKVNTFTQSIKKLLFRFWVRLLESLELEWILEEQVQQIKDSTSHECS